MEARNHPGHVDGVVSEALVETGHQRQLHGHRRRCARGRHLGDQDRLQVVHLLVALQELVCRLAFLVVPAVRRGAPHGHPDLAHAFDQASCSRGKLRAETVSGSPGYVFCQLVTALELRHDPQGGEQEAQVLTVARPHGDSPVDQALHVAVHVVDQLVPAGEHSRHLLVPGEQSIRRRRQRFDDQGKELEHLAVDLGNISAGWSRVLFSQQPKATGRRSGTAQAAAPAGEDGRRHCSPWQTWFIGAAEPADVPARGAAFFDLDKTVIAKASLIAFTRPFYREGLVTRRVLARGLWGQVLFARFGARAPTLERIRRRTLALTAGWEQERVKRVVADTLQQVIGPITYKEAVDLIEEHKQAGRRVYIVSAAPEEIVEPLARYLGAEEAIATQAAVSGGRYTGQLLRYTYGPQKAAIIRQIAERDSLDLDESWAYSDSATDLPMLEVVRHPVAVNPDRALRRIAQMRGWPVLRFEQLMVVTPTGHRPLKAGALGAGTAFLIAAIALGVAVSVKRRSAGASAGA